jgi:hypothetical protein
LKVVDFLSIYVKEMRRAD